MLLSSLMKVSSSEISISQFKAEIKEEVANYKELLRKKGVNIPILLEEDIDLSFIDIKQLLDIVNMGQLDKYEASYIADALTFSESYNCLNETDAYLIESLVLDSFSDMSTPRLRKGGC
jgi:hypothetical protein